MAAPCLIGMSTDLCPAEQSPSVMQACLLMRGLAAGKSANHALRILELGCGRAFSLVLHAAALSAECWGVDEDPGHIQQASLLAQEAGVSVTLQSRSIAELAADDSLPQFDMIILPEVWSMMTMEDRQQLIRLLHNKLKAGGVFLLSYAALPGWYAASAARGLTTAYFAAGKGAPLRIMGAMAEKKRGFFGKDSEAANLVKTTGHMQNPPICFHPQWQPFLFAEVVSMLNNARLSWGGHANPLHQMDVVNMSDEDMAILKSEDNPVLQECLRDYLLNRSSRRDLFVRGNLPLSETERVKAVGELRFSLARTLAEVPATFDSPRGSCTLRKEQYEPLLKVLADKNFAPKSVAEMDSDKRLAALDSNALLECLAVLLGLGVIHPARSDEERDAARAACDRLNAALLRAAKNGQASPRLASPVLGGGVIVPFVEQLFLASRQGGASCAREYGEEAWSILHTLGQHLQKEGKDVPYEEAEKEMIRVAERFVSDRLPLLQALLIA